MEAGKELIEMTSFLFEDGETYYFNIISRVSTIYHNIFVYKKVETTFNYIIYKRKKIEYIKIADPLLIDAKFEIRRVKEALTEIIKSTKIENKIPGWDGYVGDINMKKQLNRESKLNEIIN